MVFVVYFSLVHWLSFELTDQDPHRQVYHEFFYKFPRRIDFVLRWLEEKTKLNLCIPITMFVCSLCISTPYVQIQSNFSWRFLSSWDRSSYRLFFCSKSIPVLKMAFSYSDQSDCSIPEHSKLTLWNYLRRWVKRSHRFSNRLSSNLRLDRVLLSLIRQRHQTIFTFWSFVEIFIFNIRLALFLFF